MADFYSQKPCRVEHLWKKEKNGKVVVRTFSNEVYGLGPMGSDILVKCDSRTTIAEILDFLYKKYPQVPANQIEAETRQFLKTFNKTGPVLLYVDQF